MHVVVIEGKAERALRGAVIQGTELVGANAEDVEADIKCQPTRLNLNTPNSPVIALSGTPISHNSMQIWQGTKNGNLSVCANICMQRLL